MQSQTRGSLLAWTLDTPGCHVLLRVPQNIRPCQHLAPRESTWKSGSRGHIGTEFQQGNHWLHQAFGPLSSFPTAPCCLSHACRAPWAAPRGLSLRAWPSRCRTVPLPWEGAAAALGASLCPQALVLPGAASFSCLHLPLSLCL